MNNQSYEELDRKNFIHPLTHLGKFERGEIPSRIMESANGVLIKDTSGKEYIDAFAGLYCINVGYGRKKIIDAIKKQVSQLAYYHSYYGNATEASIKLSDMIIERAPNNMKKIYFGLTGSDANETNIKLLWHYNNLIGKTKKKKIIARIGGYHGAGILTGSLTGLKKYHENFDLPISGIIHTEAAHYFHRDDLDQDENDFSIMCGENLEQLIINEGPDTIAGFIAEPVMGNGGLVPPPKNYWPIISNILKKYEIAFISDEVITGFGRLGKMFGVEYYNIKADMITIAKGLTSAYSPLSGSIISDKISQVISDGTDEFGPLMQGSTYSAHPISCAAGVANLQLIDDENLIENGHLIANYFNNKLIEKLEDHPLVGDVRSAGLLSAVEFVKDKKNRNFFDKQGQFAQKLVTVMSKNGVLARAMPSGGTLGFAPALCLNEKEADIIIEKTLISLKEITS